jgi:hypothetical protein
MHTRDYAGRNNLGNILFRLFSNFGLMKIESGFVLFFVSSNGIEKENNLIKMKSVI